MSFVYSHKMVKAPSFFNVQSPPKIYMGAGCMAMHYPITLSPASRRQNPHRCQRAPAGILSLFKVLFRKELAKFYSAGPAVLCSEIGITCILPLCSFSAQYMSSATLASGFSSTPSRMCFMNTL